MPYSLQIYLTFAWCCSVLQGQRNSRKTSALLPSTCTVVTRGLRLDHYQSHTLWEGLRADHKDYSAYSRSEGVEARSLPVTYSTGMS